MRAQSAAPGAGYTRATANSTGDRSSIQHCLGCGQRTTICPSCAVCRDCRQTDRAQATQVAPPCILCDGGKPNITRLPWHSGGARPLRLRSCT